MLGVVAHAAEVNSVGRDGVRSGVGGEDAIRLSDRGVIALSRSAVRTIRPGGMAVDIQHVHHFAAGVVLAVVVMQKV